MKKTLFVMSDYSFSQLYGSEEFQAIADMVEILAPPMEVDEAARKTHLLAEVQIIFSGWGGPVLDEAFLAQAPKLEAFFHAAGSLRSVMTEAAWQRDLVVVSAAAANAIPVAEFTFAHIILALKNSLRCASYTRETRSFSGPSIAGFMEGHARIGIVSLGLIGSLVCKYLKQLDVEVLAFDPLATDQQFAELGCQSSSLESIFRTCHVVSLHAPQLASTIGMIKRAHFDSMMPGATLINTSRGEVVAETEMLEVLEARPDIWAVLDVLSDESNPAPGFFELPNLTVTPHIAGSVGRECRRLGRAVREDLQRYLNGEALLYRLDPSRRHLVA